MSLSLLAAAFLALAASASPLSKRGSIPGLSLPSAPIAGSLPSGDPDFSSVGNVGAKYQHAVFLSFDGMHQSDLVAYVNQFPQSTFATLMGNAIEYTQAQTSRPSDSFPGLMAAVTGASPRTHGVWYDVAYDGALYPPGTNCTGPIGTPTAWDETLDLNSTALNGGGGLNASMFPLHLTEGDYCAPVQPWDFLRVNTVFEVARSHGLVTAYTDKHPGLGLTESFFPEVNAESGLAATESYDDLHWSALQNWTMGNHWNGTAGLGVPAIYGGNFQSVSVAQKAYGYKSDLSFTANVTQALRQIDSRLCDLVSTMKAAGIFDSTLLVLYAKHGQSPIDPSKVRKIPEATLLQVVGVPTVQDSSDDGSYIWLQNKGDAAKAKANIMANASAIGAEEVWIGNEIVRNGFGNPWLDSRVPDVIIKTSVGVIFTTGAKVAEHGGLNADDLDVLLVVSNPNIKVSQCSESVSTRQIAPTLVEALGFSPLLLEGVRAEGTPSLPGVPL